MIGHATFCVVVVYNNVLARLRRTSPSLFEASMDLGADGWQTFRFVTWPVLSTALIAGGLLAFALSFDEVIVTTFTAGAQTTLPIFILDNMRQGQQLPVVNVVAFVVILLTIIPVRSRSSLTRDTRDRFADRNRRREHEATKHTKLTGGDPSTRPARRWRSSTRRRATDRRGSALRRTTSTAAVERAKAALPGVARRHAGRARGAAAQACGRDLRTTRRSSPRSSRGTSASRSGLARDEMPFSADNLRFFAGAARNLEGKSAGEYIKGYTSMVRREPLGIVGRHLPVELPADDGDLEDGPGPRGGQRRRS